MYFETIRGEDIFRYRRSLLLDLREKEKYCAGHIPGAVNIPYEELHHRLQEVRSMATGRSGSRVLLPVVVYCDRGNTSLLASRDFTKAGIPVINVYGGFLKYHGPVVKGCRAN